MLATFCELTNQPIPAGLDSIAVLPLTGKKGEQRAHKYIYFEFYEQGGRQSVRFGNWKAIRQPMLTGKVELFDLSKDLGETNNLADANPEIVKQAIALMNEAHIDHPNWKVRQ